MKMIRIKGKVRNICSKADDFFENYQNVASRCFEIKFMEKLKKTLNSTINKLSLLMQKSLERQTINGNFIEKIDKFRKIGRIVHTLFAKNQYFGFSFIGNFMIFLRCFMIFCVLIK